MKIASRTVDFGSAAACMSSERLRSSALLVALLVVCVAPVACQAAPSAAAEPADLLPRYVAAGGPALDHPWSPKEQASAWQVVGVLAQHDAAYLPQLGGVSGAIFERLIDTGTLAALRSPEQAIGPRVGQLMPLLMRVGETSKLYYAANATGGSGDVETTRVMAFNLALYELSTELVALWLPTMDTHDPSYQTRMDGLAQMRRGIVQMVQGMVISARAVDQSAQARVVALTALASYVPNIAARLPAPYRDEILASLEGGASQEKVPETRAQLERIVAATRAALTLRTPPEHVE